MKKAKQTRAEKKQARAEAKLAAKQAKIAKKAEKNARKASKRSDKKRKLRIRLFRIRRVYALINQDLKKNFDKNILQYETKLVKYLNYIGKNEVAVFPRRRAKVVIETNLQLKNYHGSVYVGITVYPDGGVVFRAVFDKIEKSYDTLNLVNAYNGNNPYYSAFIRDDGFLELRGYTVNDVTNRYKSYISEQIFRFVDGMSDDFLIQLLRYTYV